MTVAEWEHRNEMKVRALELAADRDRVAERRRPKNPKKKMPRAGVRIQMIGNNAVCIIDDKAAYSVSLVPAIEGGTQLLAYAMFGNRAASASKIVLIDWIEVWGDR